MLTFEDETQQARPVDNPQLSHLAQRVAKTLSRSKSKPTAVPVPRVTILAQPKAVTSSFSRKSKTKLAKVMSKPRKKAISSAVRFDTDQSRSPTPPPPSPVKKRKKTPKQKPIKTHKSFVVLDSTDESGWSNKKRKKKNCSSFFSFFLSSLCLYICEFRGRRNRHCKLTNDFFPKTNAQCYTSCT